MERNIGADQKRIRMLMRDEKQAFARFKDIIQKYRMILPHILGRTEKLEEKVSKLMSHSEESEKKLQTIKIQIQKERKKLKALEQKVLEVNVQQEDTVTQYNALLTGKLPPAIDDVKAGFSLNDMKGMREKFFSNIAEKFNTLESRMNALEKQRNGIDEKKMRSEQRIKDLLEKSTIIETKIHFYQGDIQKQLKELHDQMQNERKLTREYSHVIDVMEKTPGLSEWSMSLLKEAIQEKFPKTQMLELGKSEPGETLSLQ